MLTYDYVKGKKSGICLYYDADMNILCDVNVTCYSSPKNIQ